jgi:hypothetical protein
MRRQVLLQEFGAREGLHLASRCNLSLVTQLTEGYTTGQMQQVVSAVAARLAALQPAGQHMLVNGRPSSCRADIAGVAPAKQQGQRRQLEGVPSVEDVLLEVLPGVAPGGEDAQKTLRDWTAKAHTPLPPEVRLT